MKLLPAILLPAALCSCAQNSKQSRTTAAPAIKPFELIVNDADYSMAYSLDYVLTEKDLKIVFKGELEGEKDSVLFRTILKPDSTLQKLSELNLDSLKEYYANNCYEDGSRIWIVLNKDNRHKEVMLSNYYHADIGPAIELINKLVPEKYKIWYDKTVLLKDMADCRF